MGQMNVRLMLRSTPEELMIKKKHNRRIFNIPSKNDDEHDNNFKIKHFVFCILIEKRNTKQEKEIKHL